MTETDTPPAAVQIAYEAMGKGYLLLAHCAVAALARAGWLHDPAEVATLRAATVVHRRDDIGEGSHP